MKFYPAFLTVLLLLACSDRERSNPLDPLNPDTHGAPTGFQVVANRDTAWLSWEPVQVEGLEQYLLYRSTGFEPLQLYHNIGPDSTSFTEFNLQFDSTYIYALEAKTTQGLSRRTEPDTLIPGPHNFLVNDKIQSTIWNISYDGRHILDRITIDWPDALTYHPASRKVWIASNAFWDKAIYRMSVRFTQIERIALNGRPIALTFEIHGDMYVLQILPDAIHRISLSGDIIGTILVPTSIDVNAALAYDDIGNVLWLSNPVSRSSGSIYFRNPVSEWNLAANVGYPNQLLVDPIQGGCWVATDSGLNYFDTGGNRTPFLEDMQVWDISINPDYGDCYFIARQPDDFYWSIGYFLPTSGLSDILYLDIALPSPMNIQAMTASRKAGFLLGANEDGEILRYDVDGRLIGRMDGFGSILEFAVE